MQFILCVETNKIDLSDKIYVNAILDYVYKLNISNKHKKTYVYLGSKYNYNNRSILKEIRSNEQKYPGRSILIYFFDKDKFTSNPRDLRFIKEIEEYTSKVNCEVVWFVKDIENVFLGKSVSDKNKVDESIRFKKNNLVLSLKLENLEKEDPMSAGESNLLTVFDKYLGDKD
jgi:K+ transporter